jgi:proline dehydrogenase
MSRSREEEPMLRRALLAMSRNEQVKQGLSGFPPTRDVVDRFVAGSSVEEVLAAAGRLTAAGLRVTIDHLGEQTTDREKAERATCAYLDLLAELGRAGLTGAAEVSVKLSALGQRLPDGERLALENAQLICSAARAAGTTVTIDMEDHTTADSTLFVVRALRQSFPETGAVLQAYLHRTEDDCRQLATAGSRVRLCKGAYSEPSSVAYTRHADVDACYRRCMRILMAGEGYPMLATHDPKLIAEARRLAAETGRAPDSYELQMLYGVRPAEQQRLANLGHTVRVYVPYGVDWYAYLVRRLAERPANVAFFARSLLTRS